MDPDSLAPSSEAPRPEWVLHLLTGLQRDAEARLQDGIEYILGRDESCDLVLWDASVAPRHLSLIAHPGSIRVQALEQPIIASTGQLGPGEAIEFEAATSLSLGDVTLAVGRSDTHWPDLAILDPSAVTASVSLRDDGDAPEEEGDSPDVSALSAPLEGAVDDSERSSSSRPWWRADRGWLVPLMILVLVLISVGGLVLVQRHGVVTDEKIATDPEAAIARVRSIAERLGMESVEISRQPNGVPIARGYCETRAHRDALTEAAQAAGLRLANRLWPEDRVRGTLEETLGRLGRGHLDYRYLGAGKLQVQGILPPGLTSEAFSRMLRNDVPGIRNLDLDVHELDPFLADLREGLRDADLDQKLSILSEVPPITLKGRLNARDMEVWGRLREQLAERFPELPPLVSEVVHDPRERLEPSVADQSPVSSETLRVSVTPAIRVRGILIGANEIAYALLDNGEQVMRGDLIADRYRVEDIRFDRVIARVGEERHVFRVGVERDDR